MTVAFFFVILFCDQAVKAYIRSSFLPGESLPVVPHVFHITYVLNPGAAFGIFANQRLFFIAAGVLLFCLAVYFYPRLRCEGRWLRFSVASLLASGSYGAIHGPNRAHTTMSRKIAKASPVTGFSPMT